MMHIVVCASVMRGQILLIVALAFERVLRRFQCGFDFGNPIGLIVCVDGSKSFEVFVQQFSIFRQEFVRISSHQFHYSFNDFVAWS